MDTTKPYYAGLSLDALRDISDEGRASRGQRNGALIEALAAKYHRSPAAMRHTFNLVRRVGAGHDAPWIRVSGLGKLTPEERAYVFRETPPPAPAPEAEQAPLVWTHRDADDRLVEALANQRADNVALRVMLDERLREIAVAVEGIRATMVAAWGEPK